MSQTPLELIDFNNEIISSGTLQCIFRLSCKVGIHTLVQSIAMSHQFYNQITSITKLKMLSDQRITIKDVYPSRGILIIMADIECKNGQIMSQNLKIQFTDTHDHPFKVISTFYLLRKVISHNRKKHKCWKEYQRTIPIHISANDIRKYVLSQVVIDSYKLHVPNEIISTIFDDYCLNNIYCEENGALEQIILKYLISITQHPDCPQLPQAIVDNVQALADPYGDWSFYDFVVCIHQYIKDGVIGIVHWQKMVEIIFKQMIEALHFIHSNGVTHRDISLENCLIKQQSSWNIQQIHQNRKLRKAPQKYRKRNQCVHKFNQIQYKRRSPMQKRTYHRW
eukprot:41977_1